jgi:hypothetical protein
MLLATMIIGYLALVTVVPSKAKDDDPALQPAVNA